MFKNKYTITQKWQKKVEEMKIKADLKFNILLANTKRRYETSYEHEVEKNARKKAAYIKKKEEEYRRKMMNEIREMEGKPKKEYKMAGPKIKPRQFAMEIAQENAKLRDTDADGRGRCISCDRLCEWGELAGGHRYSRTFTTICLEPENINAQCHSCNWATGPKGNVVEKEKLNAHYDENIIKKFGEEGLQKLKGMLRDSIQSKGVKYDLDLEIPSLIEQNKKLWETKNFYKPKRNWEKTWNRYKLRN